jgi:hypothetical protein
MTSKTTTKATSRQQEQKKSHRINRQRRLQKQLQILLLERHSRRCIICHHPEREAIEEEFVHWRAPWKLSQDYKLNDYRTVYRHARAAGLLLQRRERLHSALDAFVESVDDVTFTGDTILRAMRAYSCIDSHGRWTEIPTQVQFSTSHDGPPLQPSPRTSNVGPSVRSNAASSLHSDILDVVPENSNNASRSDATACAASPAQAFNVPDFDDDRNEELEEDEENALKERVAALRASSKSTSHSDTTALRASSKSMSRSDATVCAAPSAQTVSAVALNSNNRSQSVTATACADSPAQALPRDVVRGQNPNDRSLSDRTDCAPLPSGGAPAQPAAPQKPKPDADGLIWHPHPGCPNQERSEPDAQGRVFYKIHMTTPASQLPSRETDAQRAAKLIYRSVIKNYGNP